MDLDAMALEILCADNPAVFDAFFDRTDGVSKHTESTIRLPISHDARINTKSRLAGARIRSMDSLCG
jgi:hypothetical protein